MGQHYEEQILQFESQNDFQTEAVAEKLHQIEKTESHRVAQTILTITVYLAILKTFLLVHNARDRQLG